MARVVFLCAAAAAVANATIELTPETFDKEVFASGKSALVKFLAPWCAACAHLTRAPAR